MSYEPTLLIKREDLLKLEGNLNFEYYSENSNEVRIANY